LIRSALIAIINANAPLPQDAAGLIGLGVVVGTDVVAVCFILLPLFWRVRVCLGPGGLDYEWRALFPLSRRHMPLHEITRVCRGKVLHCSESGTQVAHYVTFETLGEPLRFAQHIEAKEQRWLIFLLESHLNG